MQRVIGIVRRGSEILLVRESLGADGEILWSLPGGGVEDGELMHEALRRELKEETGLLVGNPVRTARAAIGKGAAAQPGRHRQQRPDRRPLRVCHVRRITAEHVPGDRLRFRTGGRHNHTMEQSS